MILQGMAHSEQQTKLSEAAVQHLLGNSAGSGMAWAGAAHWRYRTRAAARPAAAEGGEAGAEAPCCQARKTGVPPDGLHTSTQSGCVNRKGKHATVWCLCRGKLLWVSS